MRSHHLSWFRDGRLQVNLSVERRSLNSTARQFLTSGLIDGLSE